MTVSMRPIGAGLPVSFPDIPSLRGRVTVVRALPDVLALLGEDLGETLLWISEPVVTLVAPVMEEVAGILCSSGGPAAHVAIVSRELDLPCLMQCRIEDGEDIDGATLVVGADGTIAREV
jgi:signal transduction protein with GAF and PtsI domain